MQEEKINYDNSEIDKALKEFEEKSAAEAGDYQPIKSVGQKDTPKMIRLVMKLSGGAIKEQRQAEYVLLGVAIIMLLVSFYLFFGNNKPARPKLSPEQLQQMRNNLPGANR